MTSTLIKLEQKWIIKGDSSYQGSVMYTVHSMEQLISTLLSVHQKLDLSCQQLQFQFGFSSFWSEAMDLNNLQNTIETFPQSFDSVLGPESILWCHIAILINGGVAIPNVPEIKALPRWGVGGWGLPGFFEGFVHMHCGPSKVIIHHQKVIVSQPKCSLCSK